MYSGGGGNSIFTVIIQNNMCVCLWSCNVLWWSCNALFFYNLCDYVTINGIVKVKIYIIIHAVVMVL